MKLMAVFKHCCFLKESGLIEVWSSHHHAILVILLDKGFLFQPSSDIDEFLAAKDAYTLRACTSLSQKTGDDGSQGSSEVSSRRSHSDAEVLAHEFLSFPRTQLCTKRRIQLCAVRKTLRKQSPVLRRLTQMHNMRIQVTMT